MKKLILLVCFLLVSSQSYSVNLFTDNFTGTVGTLLTAPANGWTNISGTTNFLTVVDVGLTYTDFNGDPYVGSGVGSKTTLTTSGEDVPKGLSSTQTSGTLYASFMLNITAAQTGDYFFALRSSGNSHNDRLYDRSSGAGFNLGLGNAGTGVVPVYASPEYAFGTTYLVIVRYEFVAGAGNDLLTLYVFAPSDIVPLTAPVTGAVGPTTLAGQTDAVDISSVLLRQGGAALAATLSIDGIYVEDSCNNAVLPVELSSFTSSISKRDVTLNWTTSSESNNSGFEIERSSNNVWTKVGNVAGNGTVNSASSYSFTDRGLATGNYNYRLKQIDFNGNFEYFNLSNEINIGIPSSYDMSQNYPNPFNPSTTINFDVPTDGNVSIRLFDMSGKEVATLVNEVKTAGYYSVNFNASSLSSGVYFYNISSNNFTATKKMTLLK
ncbi:MAG: T9SS type A sorting domain-containing protein [Ignavibacteria bacterium]|nr:T9SS type A sorting domain-containing protein [Ignavibacteria bacterium]